MGQGRPLRGGVIGIVAALVVLAAPAGASAATFYVDDDATSPDNPCTNPNPADACTTIGTAITQARGAMFVGGDLILVAAGDYPEQVNFDDPADAGNTLDGAGSGTVIQPATGSAVLIRFSNILVRDVTVLGANSAGILIAPPIGPPGPSGTDLENVSVEMDNASAQPGIHLLNQVSNTTMDEVNVEGDADWDGADAHALKVDSSTTNTVVNDSTLSSFNQRALSIRVSSGVRINRSTLAGTIDVDQPAVVVRSDLGFPSSLTLDSSLVIFGSIGVDVQANSPMGTAPVTATILNSTIDPGAAQSIGSNVGLAAGQSGGGTNTTAVTIESSIVVGSLTTTGPGAGTMTCTYSDVPNTVDAEIDCPTDAGNPGNNSSSTPTQLFDPGLFGLNWHLKAGGPAIDTGDPGPLAAGQSTTDIEGNARVLDGNLDCIVRRDKGAYEETGLSAPCPSPPATPSTGTTPTPTSTPAPVKKKCKKKKKKKRPSAAAKKCKKKKKRK